MPDSTTAGESVTALVRQELAAEGTRKASLEQRGLSVITSSGTLIALVFAVGAVAGGGPVEVAGSGRVALLLALATFIGAALSGIVVSWTWKISAMPTDAPNGLRDFVEEAVFTGPAQAVDRRIAEAHLNQVGRYARLTVLRPSLCRSAWCSRWSPSSAWRSSWASPSPRTCVQSAGLRPFGELRALFPSFVRYGADCVPGSRRNAHLHATTDCAPRGFYGQGAARLARRVPVEGQP